ncbi:hypothetical protein MYA_4465 [Burkholderia sp. KJ006]|nr:hypothetical protein MYA_4465 [Burkholderia sp. KJ006]
MRIGFLALRHARPHAQRPYPSGEAPDRSENATRHARP